MSVFVVVEAVAVVTDALLLPFLLTVVAVVVIFL